MMADRVTVVLWKWRSTGNWKKYTAGHVNAIVNMVDRHLDMPHDFVLITDDAAGVKDVVRIVSLDDGAAKVPQIPLLPQRVAYRRVKLFAAAAKDTLGRRLLQLDLDTVIVDDITPLVDRPEPFVIWKSPSVRAPGYAYNPSFILLDAGYRGDVYKAYRRDPEGVALAARAVGWTGTDQAVIAHLAGDSATTVDERDGIVSFRDHLQRGALAPPAGTRIVSFMDRFDPADPVLQDQCPWIARHYPYRSQALAA